MTFPPLLAIINKVPDLISESELQQGVDLCETWINERLAPAWGVPMTVGGYGPTDAIPPESWKLSLFAHSDVAGALGYHALDKLPYGIVAVQDSDANGGWMPTLLHEAGELGVDPSGERCRLIGSRLYAEEIADSVEDDKDPADARYSNIVKPNYFTPGSEGPWDMLGTLPGPITTAGAPLTEGGYMSYLEITNPQAGWQQVNAKNVRAAKLTPHPFSRRARRIARLARATP